MPESTEPAQSRLPASYQGRVAAWTSRRDEELRKSALVSRFRLASFLAAAGALIWWLGYAGGMPAALLTLALVLAFGTLVFIHARIEDRAASFEALRIVNLRALAKIDRDWNGLPSAPAPSDVDLATHPYAVDLDIFGHASAFQLLGPAATPAGNALLARWLLAPAAASDVTQRQEAVAELGPLMEWRERFAAFGVPPASSQSGSLETFLAWAEETKLPLPGWPLMRGAVYGILMSMWTLFALHITGVLPNNVWALLLIAGMVLSFATAWPVTQAFMRAGAQERTLRQYADVFAHIQGQTFTGASLIALKRRLETRGRPAPAVMRSLNRILGFAQLRSGSALLHFPIQAVTLWDFHCLFALERWRAGAGGSVRDWFEATGEVDALSCIAALHHDNPSWCFPALEQEKRLTATALGHPLITERRRVANDVEVGPPGTVLLITGSNMSGKSTLLRAIGVNAVLAQCGAPVCASAFRLPPVDLYTSIRIQDSLEQGVSYFMAALARLKAVVDAAEREPGDRVLLYLLDEILQGTNSAERGVAVQAVARHLLDAGAIGAMTTHDLNVAGEEPLQSAARLVHFTETVDEQGRMSFDYRLRTGLATSRNALRLMELIGISLPHP